MPEGVIPARAALAANQIVRRLLKHRLDIVVCQPRVDGEEDRGDSRNNRRGRRTATEQDLELDNPDDTVVMLRPGATTSRAVPVPENDARASLWSVAPTEIVKGDVPGPDKSALPMPPLPAQATRTDPASRAYCRAASKVNDSGYMIRLMLIT